MTLHFSVIFEVTSDSKLYALWCPKGSQKEVFGEPFRSDFEISSESENVAPVYTGASFSRFAGTKKAMDFDAIFGRVQGGLGVALFHVFYDFGCPPGIKKESIWGLRALFLSSRIRAIFELFG
mgnify:CR=1 FL=1